MRAVDPILPVEPDVHLLTAISLLPDEWHDDAFSHGLQFQSHGECAVPTAWRMCQPDPEGDADPNEKTSDTIGQDVGFKQFMAYYAMECEDGWMHADSESRRALQARVSFDAIKHQIVAGQLWWNQAEPGSTVPVGLEVVTVNLSLKTAAVTLGATPEANVADPISVIARLVEARRKLSGSGLVLIHGPLVLVPYLITQGLIKRVGGRYEGPDFIYVTDEGYPSDAGTADGLGTAGPIETPGDPPTFYADVEGECWLYASGRVEYAWGPYVGKNTIGAPQDNDGRFSPYTTWDGRTNRWFILVEQRAFLRFDPCHVLAAKCYIPTITQGEGT